MHAARATAPRVPPPDRVRHVVGIARAVAAGMLRLRVLVQIVGTAIVREQGFVLE